MPRWAEVLLTLILFAAVMTVASWVVGTTVPRSVDWLWDRVGGVALWAAFVAIIAAAGLYAWHDHRRAGEKAKGSGT